MKPVMIIVEGPQGVGKTTLTNWLRENISSSNLLRLSGVADKSPSGKDKAYRYHDAILDMISHSAGCDIHYILDRSFITEQVYCMLGYKQYQFDDRYDVLKQSLEALSHDYDIHIVNLMLLDATQYEYRLRRNKAEYQKFDIYSSIRQQDMYYMLCNNIKVNVHSIDAISEHDVIQCMITHFGDLMPKYQATIQDMEIMKQGGTNHE